MICLVDLEGSPRSTPQSYVNAAAMGRASLSVGFDAGLNYTITALVVYDYVISLEDEVELVWRRKPSFASTLLLANRYGVLLNGILAFSSCYGKVGHV